MAVAAFACQILYFSIPTLAFDVHQLSKFILLLDFNMTHSICILSNQAA